MPNFTLSVQRLGYRTPKLKFLLRFDQKVEYKRPAWVYPLRDFHKICRVCTQFQDALAVKFSLDLLKGLCSYGDFKLTWLSPNFSAPYRRNNASDPKSFRGARTCSRSSIAMPSLSFLSVCLSVTLLNVRDCAPDFAMKALEYRNDFDTVG